MCSQEKGRSRPSNPRTNLELGSGEDESLPRRGIGVLNVVQIALVVAILYG